MADFSASLTFKRTKCLDKLIQVPLEHTTYGLKSSKSQLEVELLYENSVAHTDDTNEENRLVCGGGKPPGANKDLEF